MTMDFAPNKGVDFGLISAASQFICFNKTQTRCIHTSAAMTRLNDRCDNRSSI